MEILKRPRGTNDFLPEETAKWRIIEDQLRVVCREFGYGEIRTPVFEDTSLFQRGVGDTTDIVQKEMYTFTMKGEHSLTLRPENTASVARAYLENKLYGGALPVKLYYLGPQFRYERPQAGRFRQFHQFGVELFGAESPYADAEVISLAWTFYSRLGIKNMELHLNSVGCPSCRPAHKKALQKHLEPVLDKLCPVCRERYERNPLRILDCKNPDCQELTKDAPTTADCLCTECGDHFSRLKSALNTAGIPFLLDKRLVRGLDYYTKTAFEIMVADIGAQSSICGGGRYDGLLASLGGEPTPGVGFALGMERVFAALKAQGDDIETAEGIDVFIVAHPADNQKIADTAFSLANSLRTAGFAVEQDLLGRSMKSQFKAADRLRAAQVIVIGEDEIARGIAAVRDMSSSEQSEIPLDKLKAFLMNQYAIHSE